MKRVFPILAILSGSLLSYALYEALVPAPTDQLQGDVYRIIYYHVPSAWTTFVFFTVNFVASVIYLFRRSAKADAIAVAGG
jgi:heme exporter protein C